MSYSYSPLRAAFHSRDGTPLPLWSMQYHLDMFKSNVYPQQSCNAPLSNADCSGPSKIDAFCKEDGENALSCYPEDFPQQNCSWKLGRLQHCPPLPPPLRRSPGSFNSPIDAVCTPHLYPLPPSEEASAVHSSCNLQPLANSSAAFSSACPVSTPHQLAISNPCEKIGMTLKREEVSLQASWTRDGTLWCFHLSYATLTK